MRSEILLVGLLFCGFSSTHGEDTQAGDVPIKVGSLTFMRRPLAQRSINTVTSTYYYPSPRLEYFSAFSPNPLDSLRYASSYFPYYNPSLSAHLSSQVYTHYPYISGGHISPLIINLSAA